MGHMAQGARKQSVQMLNVVAVSCCCGGLPRRSKQCEGTKMFTLSLSGIWDQA